MEILDADIEMFFEPLNGNPMNKNDVTAHLSDVYNRHPLPCEQERQLDSVWADRLHGNPRLWDGSKFRIDSASTENGKCVLNLGITGYKDFLSTNFSPHVSEIQQAGVEAYGDKHTHLAHPLGVGALVHTADDHFVLLRRSNFCGEAVGKLDVPGGHPEPEELVGKLPASEIKMEMMSAEAVVHEIFDSIHREVCDEVNLPKDKVTFPELLGIVRNTPSAGRPTAEFYSSEIKTLYDEGTQPDAEETTNILFVPMSAIPNMETDPQYMDIWRQLTASAKGAVTLFKMTSLINNL